MNNERTPAELLEMGVAMMDRYNEAARRDARARAVSGLTGRTFGRKGLHSAR